MAKKVVILGAGPAARYVGYILSYDPEIEVVGFTDRDSSIWGTEIHGKPVLGADEVILDLYAKGVRHAVVGLGNPQVRSKLRKLAVESGFELINAIHPSAILSPAVKLGTGVVVEAGSVISDNPILDDNVWVGLAVMVAHDTHIGRDSEVGGGAAVGAEVIVGERVMIGMGSVIQSGRRIGDDAIVGSGANVVRDVPARVVVVGNPAKVIRYRDE